MMNYPRLPILLGFIIALALSILPTPEFLSAFRPPWALLLILYIEYFLPGKFRVITLLFLGLILDVLLSTVLGEHSFALLLLTWIASSKSRRFQFFTMPQQIALIGFFCFSYQAIITCLDALLGFDYIVYMPLTSMLAGMFFWPWIRLLCDDLFLPDSLPR